MQTIGLANHRFRNAREILESSQNAEKEGESDHLLEIQENFELLKILPVRRLFS